MALSQAQRRLLRDCAHAPGGRLQVPGARYRTAKALMRKRLLARVQAKRRLAVALTEAGWRAT